LEIQLAFGRKGLLIDLNDEYDITVISPNHHKETSEPEEALRSSLRLPLAGRPLSELVNKNDRIAIVFNDITRPTPNEIIITQIINKLADIPNENILLFNALGTHRKNTYAELRRMLGDELVDRFQVIQNNAFDKSTQVYLGKSSRGREIWINKDLMQCDLRILTGFIEPHFFAGFSGGGKALMPGMAGLKTILGNHGFEMISHPQATWGITAGNPVWEEIHEIAELCAPLFLVNVTLNKDKKITGIFSGELKPTHATGCSFVSESSMVPVPNLFDIVITTNSGYPLDMNLYQSIKGLSAAARVVRKGGVILLASECSDGIPEHGLYRQLLKEADSPKALLQCLQNEGFEAQDQWQVQIQAQIQLLADVFVYSPNLTDEQIIDAMFKPCRSIEQFIAEQPNVYGPGARICVLPEGPQCIPYLQNENAF
jgi:lactate racemase